MSILRPYQRQALDAFWERILQPALEEWRLAISMATGLGKTVTGAQAAVEWLDAHPGTRVLVLVHTDEIVGQWVSKLEFAARGRYSVGVVKASRHEPAADIVVASVWTLANPERRDDVTGVRFIIVDECHHAVAPTYLALLEHYGANAGIPTLGLTATLERGDGQGLGQVWQDLVFSRGITWAQRHGYLLDIVPWAIKVPDIAANAPDAALDAMLADGIAPETVVETWIEKVQIPWANDPGRRPAWCSTVLFAPLVKSAQAFADAFNAKGIRAEVIHGNLPPEERKLLLKRYEAGEVVVLCNAMVLTEGWDSPRTMCVVWARRAKGPLFIQGVGRGARPWLGHPDAPPRELQRCILLLVTDAASAALESVSDLSDRPLAEAADGKSLLEMADEYDLGRALDEEQRQYRGPVRVEEWDLAVQASSKAWKYTKGGVPFLPTAKRSQGYVFVVGTEVHAYMPHPKVRGRYGAKRVGKAPDTSLALALAEDEAQERGGDIGALLADKGRAWRKQVPSMDAIRVALAAGVTQAEIDRILAQRAAGKAGKLSDLTDTLMASRALDPIATKLRERATA